MATADVIRPNRTVALGIVVALVGLLVWGLAAGSRIPADTFSDEGYTTDSALYEALAHRVADGDDYYRSAIEEQVARGFPTTPAATVRVPTLAHLQAMLGDTGSRVVLVALLALGTLLLLRRLEQMTDRRSEWYVGALAFGVAVVVPFVGTSVWFHESWALALIMISLGLVDQDRWWPSVVVGVLAPFVRELALLYVGVRFLIALFTNRREALAWAAGGVAFVGFYVWHIAQVAAVQVADPPPSPGWLDASGWPFIVDSVRTATVLSVAPHWVTAVIAPLAVFGWLFVRGYVAQVFAAVVLAYVLAFCLIGQSGNIYWGLLYASPLMIGLAFVPRGAMAVTRALRT